MVLSGGTMGPTFLCTTAQLPRKVTRASRKGMRSSSRLCKVRKDRRPRTSPKQHKLTVSHFLRPRPEPTQEPPFSPRRLSPASSGRILSLFHPVVLICNPHGQQSHRRHSVRNGGLARNRRRGFVPHPLLPQRRRSDRSLSSADRGHHS